MMLGGSLLVACLSPWYLSVRRLFPMAALVLSLSIGAYLGLFLLLPFSLHVYLKHQFPLLAALLLVPKAVLLTLLIDGVRKIRSADGSWLANVWARSCRVGLAGLAAICVLDVIVHTVWVHQRANYFDLGWLEFARQHPLTEVAAPLHYFPPRVPPAYEGLEPARDDTSGILELLDRRTGRLAPPCASLPRHAAATRTLLNLPAHGPLVSL